MAEPESLLLNPTSVTSVAQFLYNITSWASRTPNPDTIVNRFEIVCIVHNKNRSPPEHEYLVIETKDTKQDGRVRFFILERTASNEPDTSIVENDNSKKISETIEQMKRLASAVQSSTQSSLESMEEGLKSLSIKDELTLSSVKSADLLSNSLKSVRAPAVDNFLGESYACKHEYCGEMVKFFKPVRLNLFELALLAHVAHVSNPHYAVLNTQCFFYAGLVYAAAERYAGSVDRFDPSISGKDKVFIRGSSLSNKYGRWNSIKVTSDLDNDSPAVIKLVNDFNEKLQSEKRSIKLLERKELKLQDIALVLQQPE